MTEGRFDQLHPDRVREWVLRVDLEWRITTSSIRELASLYIRFEMERGYSNSFLQNTQDSS